MVRDFRGDNTAYCNPYMLELAGPSALSLSAMDNEEFPPAALSLMYTPPVDDDDDEDSDREDMDEWVQNVDELLNVSKLMRPTVSKLMRPSTPRAGVSPHRGISNLSPSLVRPTTPRAAPRRAVGDPGDVQPSVPHVEETAPKGGSRSTSTTRRGHSQSPSEEGNSDVGAESIASINRCIAKAQGLPEQQRPNSEKWTERWASLKVDHKGGKDV